MEAEMPDGTVLPMPHPDSVFLALLADGITDVKELAGAMTDTERNAVLINIYRQNCEILQFARMMTATMTAMGSIGGVQGNIARKVLPADLLAVADGVPRPNRAERRAAGK